jgi:hypothetical protein
MPGPTPTLDRSWQRTVRRQARPTITPTTSKPSAATPVLLGPADLGGALTDYCRQDYGRGQFAIMTRDGWQCVAFFQRPHTIDLGAFCRSMYGSTAAARLVDTRDQRSWRCYRGGS